MKKVLILGGNGILGKSIVSEFSRAGWRTISADIGSSSSLSSSFSSPLFSSVTTIALSESDGPALQVKALLRSLDEKNNEEKNNNGYLDAVICVAGGWSGGTVGSDDFISNFEKMQKVCLQPSVVAAQIAALRLRRQEEVEEKEEESGGSKSGSSLKGEYRKIVTPPLFALTGAAAALSPSNCQGMLAYGLAKSATHFLAQTLAGSSAGLPLGSRSVCILPRTIDTPSNRQYMQGADTSLWTPPSHIARQLSAWCGVTQQPLSDVSIEGEDSGTMTLFPNELISGSLIIVETEARHTQFKSV
jgi:dihydropteridine reductase